MAKRKGKKHIPAHAYCFRGKTKEENATATNQDLVLRAAVDVMDSRRWTMMSDPGGFKRTLEEKSFKLYYPPNVIIIVGKRHEGRLDDYISTVVSRRSIGFRWRNRTVLHPNDNGQMLTQKKKKKWEKSLSQTTYDYITHAHPSPRTHTLYYYYTTTPIRTTRIHVMNISTAQQHWYAGPSVYIYYKSLSSARSVDLV